MERTTERIITMDARYGHESLDDGYSICGSKVGFCSYTTGMADDEELERIATSIEATSGKIREGESTDTQHTAC
jgi:hypothetical protein